MKLHNCLLSLAIAFSSVLATSSGSASSEAQKVLSKWDTESLKNFLDDYHIPYSKKSKTQELLDKASAQWDGFTRPYSEWSPQYLKAYAQRRFGMAGKALEKSKDDLVKNVGSVWDETAQQTSDAYQDVSTWLYQYWTKDELAKLLGKKKRAEEAMTHSQLVKEAQGLLRKKHSSTSYYPGDWTFEKLSTQDLRDILKKRSIPFSKSDGRKSLVSILRRNLRLIYLEGQYKVVKCSDFLNFESRKFFDKTGKFLPNVFSDWTKPDLQIWLLQHDLISLKDAASYKQEQLVDVARANVQYLVDDISTWTTYKAQHTTPFLSKATDTVDNLVDHTYNLWSGSRLEAFLASLGIPWLKSSNPRDTLSLLEKYKDSTAETVGTWSFKDWSSEDIKKWLLEQGQKAEGTREQLVDSADAYLRVLKASSFGSAGQDAYNSVASSLASARQTAFDSWTNSQLKAYVESFGEQVSSMSRDDLIEYARSHPRKLASSKDSTADAVKTWLFDDWSSKDLKKWLVEQGQKAEGSREQLADSAALYLNSLYVNKAAPAGQQVLNSFESLKKNIFDSWSDSQLKSYVDSLGDQIQANTMSRQELVEYAQTHFQVLKTSTERLAKAGDSSWSFDSWSSKDIKNWLIKQGQKAEGTHEQLVNWASSYLNSLFESNAGKNAYESVATGFQNAKQAAFDTWTDSQLKAYVDSFGNTPKKTMSRDDLLKYAKEKYLLVTQGQAPLQKTWLQSVKDIGTQLQLSVQYWCGRLFNMLNWASAGDKIDL